MAMDQLVSTERRVKRKLTPLISFGILNIPSLATRATSHKYAASRNEWCDRYEYKTAH
jgi:hypothetical protein